MEKTATIIKTYTQEEHSFYCDECEKYLGTSQEYDDGWYQKLGEFELDVYIDDWYRLKKCLCDECEKAYVDSIQTELINKGFKKD